MKRFSESVFFSLKNQRVDAKVASGIDAHKIHRVKRIPPRELKRKKKKSCEKRVGKDKKG